MSGALRGLGREVQGLARHCPARLDLLARQSPVRLDTLARFSLSARVDKIAVDPRVLDIPVQYGVDRQVWVESLATREVELGDIMTLHPEVVILYPWGRLRLCVQVWAVYPRIDIIHQNLVWQQKYNVVNYNHVKVRRWVGA